MAAAAVRSLSRHAWFAENEAAALSDLARPGDVCVDVGAEFGLYTLLFAEAVGRSGRVVAVEANPTLAHRLRRAVAALGADNVDVLATGVDDRDEVGFTRLSVPFRRELPVWGRSFVTDGASDHGPNSEFGESEEIIVPALSLDRVVTLLDLEQVNIVKSDIEGAELAMLLGSEKLLHHDRPLWMLEIEDRHLAKYGASADEVLEVLRSADYGVFHLVDRQWRRCDGLVPGHRNYLFIPEETDLWEGHRSSVPPTRR